MERRVLVLALIVSLFAALLGPHALHAMAASLANTNNLALSPSSGASGTGVQVSGSVSRSLKGTTVQISWDGSTVVAMANVQGTGNFSTQFNVPTSSAGGHTVVSLDAGTTEAQTTFTVTGAANTPTDTPVPPTATSTPINTLVPPTATAVSTRTPVPTATNTTTADVTVNVNRSLPAGTSQLAVGTTHTQYSLDSWGNAAAISSAKSLLSAGVAIQNQHIYGWGASNPEPSPGVYNWSSLDTRINLMHSMGTRAVITLCCAPDWMTVPVSDESTYYGISWQRWTDAPTPDHFAAFADLARQIALRYSAPSNPNPVLYYDVWNEFKGIPWDSTTNNWDVSYYTDLYNAVYDAVKGVNPNIKVGGLYLPIEGSGTPGTQWYNATPITSRNLQTIQYWLANKHGADFISFDRGVFDPHDPTSYTQDQAMYYTRNFELIASQLRSLTSLPIWCAETYFMSQSDANLQYTAAGYASALYHLLKGGANVALQWQPQGVDPSNGGPANGSEYGSLFTDTRLAGGGQPYPDYSTFKLFHQDFPPGTQLYQATSTASDVLVLASATTTLLINQRSTTVTVNLNGSLVSLSPYQVAAF